MYSALGTRWASSIPAFLALACLPAPFVLYKYGAAIRRRCKFAAQAEAVMNELRAKAAQQDDSDDVTRTESSVSGAIDEEKGEAPKFEPIRPSRTRADSGASLQRVKTSGTVAEAARYDSNPYDIDRTYTRDTVTGLDEALSRTLSRARTRDSRA